MQINGLHYPGPYKGYWWDWHYGLATDQTNFGTTIVPIHLTHETWQYCHVWHIPLELDQVRYMWWYNFHCILHQFNIRQWDLIVKSSKMDDFWYIDPWVPRLYLTHWWDTHQDLRPLNNATQGLWFNGRKRCILWITRWLWTIMEYSFTWMLPSKAHFMMSPSCTSKIYTKISSNFLCILMSTLRLRLFRWRNVCYVLVWEVWVCSWTWPKCN